MLDILDVEEEIPDEGPCSSSSDASEEVESDEFQEETLWINSVTPDCLVVPDVDNEMLPQKMDEMKQQCEAWLTEAVMLTLEKEPDARVEPTCWEVFVEDAKITAALQSRYPRIKCAIYSIQNGWDFRRRNVREAFLQELNQQKPGMVWISPPYRVAERDLMTFAVQVFDAQRSQKRRAVLEIPRHSDTHVVWPAKAYLAELSFCRTSDSRTDFRLSTMFCSSRLLSQRLHLKCRCPTAHRITKENWKGSDNYTWTFANLAAALVACQTEEELDQDQWHTDAFPAEEVGGPAAEEDADAHEIPESGDPEYQRFLQDV